MNHENIFLLSVVLMLLVSFAFLFVFVNATKMEKDYAAIQKKAYKNRNKLFIAIMLAGVVIAFGSTRNLPYPSDLKDHKEIDVVGKQWYWELSDTQAQVNQPITFNVSSADVNHGLGIYDEDLRLLSQVQAMPGYVNKLEFKFDKPGTYKLMCMEYCGLVHHAMISDFTVTQE